MEPFCIQKFMFKNGALDPERFYGNQPYREMLKRFQREFNVYLDDLEWPFVALNGNVYALQLVPDIDFGNINTEPADVPVKLDLVYIGRFAELKYQYNIPVEFYYEWLKLVDLPRDGFTTAIEFGMKYGFKVEAMGAKFVAGRKNFEHYSVIFHHKFVEKQKSSWPVTEFYTVWHQSGNSRKTTLDVPSDCLASILEQFYELDFDNARSPRVLMQLGINNYAKKHPNRC